MRASWLSLVFICVSLAGCAGKIPASNPAGMDAAPLDEAEGGHGEPLPNGTYERTETMIAFGCTSAGCYGSRERTFDRFFVFTSPDRGLQNISYAVEWTSPSPVPPEVVLSIANSEQGYFFEVAGTSSFRGTAELPGGNAYTASIRLQEGSFAAGTEILIRIQGPLADRDQ